MSKVYTRKNIHFMYANDDFFQTEKEFSESQNILLKHETYAEPALKIKDSTSTRTKRILSKKKRRKKKSFSKLKPSERAR